MITTVRLGSRPIGKGYPCFVIAEAGVNHNGNVGKALQMIDLALKAGADAIKFQTFRSDQVVTRNAPKAAYQLKSTDHKESQYDMLKKLELSADSHRDLFAYCRKKGILFLSTPFSEESADLLDELGVQAFKIPSGEITNLPLLEHIARKGKLMIVSTGMSDLDDVRRAIDTIGATRHCELLLLHCVSNYPTKPEDVNLRAMKTMEEEFQLPVGFSDHTLGYEIPLAAVAMGACVIEKHFTLSRDLSGPDHKASLEPRELEAMISGIRKVEASLGTGKKQPARSEADTAHVARRSLVAACDLPAGTVIRREHIVCRRPGTGLPPARIQEVIGKKVARRVKEGSLLKWSMFQ